MTLPNVLAEPLVPTSIAGNDLPLMFGSAMVMTPGWDPEADPRFATPYIIAQGPKAESFQWKSKPLPLGAVIASMCIHKEGPKDGPAFVGGEVMGDRRKAAAMKQLTFAGLDIDTGMPSAQIDAILAKLGCMAVRYTTHSHMKTRSEFLKSKLVKFAQDKFGDGEITTEVVQAFMRDVGKFETYIVESAEYVDEDHTEGGVKVIVEHAPIPKNRIVLPLAEPFVVAKEAPIQKDAIDRWKKIPTALAERLGVPIDITGVDPSRLFYYPRHKRGASFECVLFGGELFNWRSLDIDNPFLAAAAEMEKGGRPKSRSRTEEGKKLGKWSIARSQGFQIADVLREHCEDRIRAEVQSGIEIECPFDQDHSNAGDSDDRACLAVNAGDGVSPIFTVTCRHESCHDKTALDMLGRMLADGWFPAEVIHDEDYNALMSDANRPAAPPALGYPPSSAEGRQRLCKMRVHESRDELVRDMSKHAAVLIVSNRVHVIAEKGNGRFDLLRASEAGTWYAPMQLLGGTEANPKFFPGLKVYLESPDRLEFEGITSDPTVPFRTAPLYTTWRGFSRKPRRGSWALMRRHLRDVICAGDDHLLLWLLCWMAQMLQQPGTKLGTAVVIRGGKGTGKSTVANWLRDIIGELHSRKVSQSAHVTGKFNDHLRDCLFLSVEEGVWGGDRAAEGVLKDMITADTLMIEPKGLGIVEFPNFTRIMITSNEAWIIPASGDERRFLVLDAVNIFGGDPGGEEKRRTYFTALYGEASNGGVEAMMADLMELDICQVDLRKPPLTDGLRAQVAQTFTPEQEWLLSALISGEFTQRDGKYLGDTWEMNSPLTIANEDLLASWNDHVRAYGGSPAGVRRMMALLKAHGDVERHRLTGIEGDRPWGVKLAQRKEWRERFEQTHHYQFERDPTESGGDADGRVVPFSANLRAFGRRP